jgi:glycosyltransferase involved in cell wall biosynthesis
MKLNILFIGKRFYTNRDAIFEKYGRIYQIPWCWAKNGHDVKLWLVDYHGKETLNMAEERLDILSTPVKNLQLFRYWLSGKYRTDKKIDVVVASGDCYIGLMGYLIAKKNKSKFVFDVYDKYDEFGGYIKPFGFDLFGFLLKKADTRFFASQKLLEGIGQAEDCILENGIDASRFGNISQQEAREKAQIKTENYLVGYFGGMEPDRGVEDLIDAIQLLRSQSIPVELVLGGNAPDGLNLNRPGVRYLGNIPFNNIPYMLAACDVLTVPYRRSPFMDAGASNKIAEAMICERPIVATRTPNLSANFPLQAHALEPYLAEPANPESLALAIKKQLEDRLIVEKPEGIYWHQIAAKVGLYLEEKIHGKD